MTIQPPHPPVITVFGGTGFLGRHIIRNLAKSGAVIRVATRSPASAYFLRPLGQIGQIVPVRCDVNDDASVAAVLDGATHAVNLVGILFERGRQRFDRLHAELPGRIGRIAAAKKLALVVHISALGAAANGPSRYSRSKAAGEDALRAAFARHVILRPSVVFGPEDNFFNMFARMAQKFHMLPLIAGGQTRFQPVYVGDIAEAVTRVIDAPTDSVFVGKTYTACGPQVYSMKELMRITLQQSRLSACLLPLPGWAARLMAMVSRLLPRPLITADQIRQLSVDNVQHPNVPGIADLGVAPTDLRAVLPSYMLQYWPGGRFLETA